MASCIVCNRIHVTGTRHLDDVVEHTQTLRLRLEKVLEEPVPRTGWLCFSCQFDLRQIETYYRLVTVFRQRYRETCRQWKQVGFKVDDSKSNSVLLDNTYLQSDCLLKLGKTDVPRSTLTSEDDQVEKNQSDGKGNACLNRPNKPRVAERALELPEMMHDSDGEDTGLYTNDKKDTNILKPNNPEPNEKTQTSKKNSKYKKRPKQYGSFRCAICNKVFRRVLGLNVHMRIHGEKKAGVLGSSVEGHNDHLKEPIIQDPTNNDCGSLDIEVTEINDSGVETPGFDNIEEPEVPEQRPSTLMPRKRPSTYVRKYPPVKDGSYECQICNRVFRKPIGLDMHMRVHRKKNPKPPSLSSANMAEQTQSGTMVGKSHHKQEITRRQSKRFTLSLETKPTEQKGVPFECTICKTTFLGTHGLKQHMTWHARRNDPILGPEDVESKDFEDLQAKVFECTPCDKRFKSHAGYLTHLRWHPSKDDIEDTSIGTEPLFCSVCDLTFYKQSALEAHFEMHTTESKPDEKSTSDDSDGEPKSKACSPNKKRIKINDLDYDPKNPDLRKVGKKREPKEKKETEKKKKERLPCTHCDKTFLTQGYLRRHIATHTGWPLVCSVCYKGFLTPSKLKMHMVKHSDARPYICDQCGKGFKRAEQMRQHMRFHTGETLACVVCRKRFVWQSALDIHMKTHTVYTLLQCSFCERTFTSNASLVDHVRSHTGEKKTENKHPCWKCGLTFQKDRLKFHMMTHTGEKKQSCSVCGKRFYTKKAVYIHMRVHSSAKPYKCDQCGLAYKTNGNLTIHKRGHANIRPYKCSVCNKAFRASNHVQRHMLCHTEGAISCSICWRTFRRKMNMEAHMRTHSEDKPYPCTSCNISFRQLKTLKRHLRKHTENPDQVPRTRMINPSNAYNRARDHIISKGAPQTERDGAPQTEHEGAPQTEHEGAPQTEQCSAQSLGLPLSSNIKAPNQEVQNSSLQEGLGCQDGVMVSGPTIPVHISGHGLHNVPVVTVPTLYTHSIPVLLNTTPVTIPPMLPDEPQEPSIFTEEPSSFTEGYP